MKRVILLFSLIVTSVVLLSCCQSSSYPVYHTEKNESGSSYITIDGVNYIRGLGDWGLDYKQIGNMIGYLDDTAKPIYEMQGDNGRNYIFIKISSAYYDPYFKENYTFPEISADTVDYLLWWSTENTRLINDINTKNILFKELSKDENNDVSYALPYGQITCYFKQAQGLYYLYSVVEKDGRYFCGDYVKDKFVNIKNDFIEKLKGDNSD